MQNDLNKFTVYIALKDKIAKNHEGLKHLKFLYSTFADPIWNFRRRKLFFIVLRLFRYCSFILVPSLNRPCVFKYILNQLVQIILFEKIMEVNSQLF